MTSTPKRTETSWAELAACSNRPDLNFFPSFDYDIGKHHKRIPEVDVCMACPVWLDCLDDTDETGLRGRLSPFQRKKLEAHRKETLEDFILDVVPSIVNLARELAEA